MAAWSRREHEVLDGLTNGGSSKEIARQLEICTRAVEIRHANIMTKLGVNRSSEAIRLKLGSGLGSA